VNAQYRNPFPRKKPLPPEEQGRSELERMCTDMTFEQLISFALNRDNESRQTYLISLTILSWASNSAIGFRDPSLVLNETLRIDHDLVTFELVAFLHYFMCRTMSGPNHPKPADSKDPVFINSLENSKYLTWEFISANTSLASSKRTFFSRIEYYANLPEELSWAETLAKWISSSLTNGGPAERLPPGVELSFLSFLVPSMVNIFLLSKLEPMEKVIICIPDTLRQMTESKMNIIPKKAIVAGLVAAGITVALLLGVLQLVPRYFHQWICWLMIAAWIYTAVSVTRGFFRMRNLGATKSKPSNSRQ
jgi:hypothetical protein